MKKPTKRPRAQNILNRILRELGGKRGRDLDLLPVRIAGCKASNVAYVYLDRKTKDWVLENTTGENAASHHLLALARKLDDLVLYLRLTAQKWEPFDLRDFPNMPNPKAVRHNARFDFDRN